MELTSRQAEIVDLVRKKAPITGDQIAEYLGATRPAIRADLVLLGMLKYIEAKPKVGYTLGTEKSSTNGSFPGLRDLQVKSVMGIPVVVRENEPISDAIVKLFLENVGSLIVADAGGALAGIVSRKDFLKVTMGSAQSGAVPVSLVMTRYPNVVTVMPEDSVLEAMRKMIVHDIGGLPVVQPIPSESGPSRSEAVGRITKTTIMKLIFEMTADKS